MRSVEKLKRMLLVASICFSTILLFPFLLTYRIRRALGGGDTAFECHSQWLSIIPGRLGNLLRLSFYLRTLAACDITATFSFGCLLSKSASHIGKHVYIGPYCILGWVHLEDDVLLGSAVQIPSGPYTHGIARLDVPIRCQPGLPRCVRIGRDSWIGVSSVILADVGQQAIIGANSTVTKNIPDRAIAVGSPAKVIDQRDSKVGLDSEASTSVENVYVSSR